MGGGLQTRGVKAAKAKQRAEAEEMMRMHPDVFEWGKQQRKGRLSGVRSRLRVDLRKQWNVSIGSKPAGLAITQRVRRM